MHNLTISNIAWELPQEQEVFSILRELEISSLEIAPGKYFKDLGQPTKEELQQVNDYFRSAKLHPESFQSLLYGYGHLQLFTSRESREELSTHLQTVVDIASYLGTQHLIFGSPKNRSYRDMPREEAYTIAQDFFYELGNYAHKQGTCICIEPNPSLYETNFLTTTEDTIQFVQALQNPGIGIHIDTGTIILNKESPKIFTTHQQNIRHIHISEPFLANQASTFHEQEQYAYLQAIASSTYQKWISLEMLTKESSDPIKDIRQSLLRIREFLSRAHS